MNHPLNGSVDKDKNIDFVRDCAFALFAREGINKVRMVDIAKESKYGIATVYRYFRTKKRLVIDIEIRKIKSFVEKIEKGFNEFFVDKTAIEGLDYLLSWFTYLYNNERDWLKFDSNFDGYIQQEAEEEDKQLLAEYHNSLQKLGSILNIVYEAGQKDNSVKIEQTLEEMYFHLMYSMLSITERLAFGTIFFDNNSEEAIKLIESQRKMIVEAYRA